MCRYQPYFNPVPLTNVTTPFEIYATSTNTSTVDDACDPLPENTPDLTDKVVVIRRGSCAFTTKCENAAKFGAKLIFIYKLVFAAHPLRVQWLTTPCTPSTAQAFTPIATEGYTATLIRADEGALVSSTTLVTLLAFLMRFIAGQQLCSR